MDKKSRQLFGVIGSPVSHSLSPLMQQHWLKDAGLKHLYQPFCVEPPQLEAFVIAAEALNLGGFNVTFPLKRKIMDYLDEIDPVAAQLGAVNTVIRQSGKWIGLNTDGKGFFNSLCSHFPNLHDQPPLTSLIIGAGGAARAISFELATHQSLSLCLTNRTAKHAKDLVSAISAEDQIKVISISEAEKQLSHFDLIINTTAAGFADQEGEIPLKLDTLSPQTIVVDIIYKPFETPFLKIAKQNGNRTLNGLPMLIHQGALSFQQWHGIYPDTNKMAHFLTKKLEADHVNK